MMFCGLVPGLVESQFLHASPSADIDTEPCHARSPTEVNEKCPDYSNSGPSSRRQAPVESEFLPKIYDPVPDPKGFVCLRFLVNDTTVCAC